MGTTELLFVFLATRPEFKKPKRCRRFLVGPMRKFLIQRTGVAILDEFSHVPEQAAALIKDRAETQGLLTEFCARCGRCPLGKR